MSQPPPQHASRYELTWPGKQPPVPPAPARLRWTDAYDGPSPHEAQVTAGFRNRLCWGDNLGVMAALLPEFGGRVDLVYLDPPFTVGRHFKMGRPVRSEDVPARAYADVDRTEAYLQAWYERLALVRELLSETGSLIVHVNWRVAPLVQLLLDELFGAGERRGPGLPGFRNEIVWGYGGGGAQPRAYRRKHDNLFWYTRSHRWTFHPQHRPYTEKTRQRGLTAVKGDRYALREAGATLETWWTDEGVQKILSPTARENLKYPTQKPEALLERLLRGHSSPGELVADFCCGAGTTGAVAERLGRRWLMVDASPLAVHTTRTRLAESQEALVAAGQPFRPFDLYRDCAADEDAATAPGSLRAERVERPDGTLHVCLRTVPPGADAWAVDFAYGSLRNAEGTPVFRHQWRGRAPAPGLVSSAGYRPEAGERFPVALKVTDAQGRETRALAAAPARENGGNG
jgi:DNA modification methylase